MVQEDACLDSNRPLVQSLESQMRNQALQKKQDLKYQKSNEKQEQTENKNKEMHDQYFECIIINMLNIQQILK